ncbi:Thiol:disulfide interchange protein DsbD [Pseudoxanthomonas wuyuanensis]|uniref:Thiol:disulfide interchange protein DsbD n=1 Tax=Pseudoxanthomonas wuyuanensis TaxID=1073196 RepID=A0A286D276_9GAMM|nr:protein-disulfide reductase DsbD [Pseudoxanthomonas wuyuanensis]SOD52758.1 Thiol:disulfide interchange protein DsbD [Pseudoxanthomonas wuyuanensis]
MISLRRLLAPLTLCLAALPAQAADLDDLLPVDQAFALSAAAPSRDRIEVQWKIADGYYLYRHRTSVQAGPGFDGGPLQLPKGKAYTDEFFGDVETYRGQLTATLPGSADAGADSVALTIKYQGCADAGICYPPQTRTLTVALPAAGATRSGGFTPLGRLSLPGAASTAPQFDPPAGSDALPLPQEQAFAFEAIAFDGNQLLLRFTPARGYYLYRDRTTMTLQGADGIALQAPRWPKGVPHRDEHFGEVTVYFDQVEVPVPLRRNHARPADAMLQVTFQGCQNDGICYPPMTRQVALSIPAGSITPADQPVTAAPTVPGLSSPAGIDAAAGEDAAAGVAGDPSATDSADESAADVPRTTPPEQLLRGNSRAPASFLLALLLALGGGLILNLMPCVLPVLSLKALSLAESGRSGGHARSSALWYTAGVLVSFIAIGALAIALRAAGQALGWGFQLQQPLVIGLLAYVMFAVGLSLSGVFAIGYRLAGAGAALTRRSGPAGDFFTGVLAVVIASPCTAPFMGAALAFAFASPTPLALAVFAALGLGLALPFLLIGFVPALANRLPRPGAWMETLKHALAFPMYLTAIWLLWVLGKQRGVDALALVLAGMVLLAAGLWWFQRVRMASAPLQRALAVLLAVSALVPLAMAQRLPRNAAAVQAVAGTVAYSAERLAALRAEGRIVFVDMTADWCVTCKANERAVINTDAFRELMRQHDAVLMQGDWTNVDPAITAFLESHKAVGVPLYVVYPRSGGAGEVLPTVLTHRRVRQALERAAQ